MIATSLFPDLLLPPLPQVVYPQCSRVISCAQNPTRAPTPFRSETTKTQRLHQFPLLVFSPQLHLLHNSSSLCSIHSSGSLLFLDDCLRWASHLLFTVSMFFPASLAPHQPEALAHQTPSKESQHWLTNVTSSLWVCTPDSRPCSASYHSTYGLLTYDIINWLSLPYRELQKGSNLSALLTNVFQMPWTVPDM